METIHKKLTLQETFENKIAEQNRTKEYEKANNMFGFQDPAERYGPLKTFAKWFQIPLSILSIYFMATFVCHLTSPILGEYKAYVLGVLLALLVEVIKTLGLQIGIKDILVKGLSFFSFIMVLFGFFGMSASIYSAIKGADQVHKKMDTKVQDYDSSFSEIEDSIRAEKASEIALIKATIEDSRKTKMRTSIIWKKNDLKHFYKE